MIWEDEYGYLETIASKKKFGIFLDMGMGKTSLLLALCNRKLKEGVKKILIFAPKNVTLKTWQNEMQKWDNFNHLLDITTLIEGTPKKRYKMLEESGERFIHIISSDLAEWLTGTWVEKPKQPRRFVPNKLMPNYDMVIVDECSQFSSPKTARFKALKRMDPGNLYLLSGTPFSNITEEKGEYLKADEGLYYIMFFFGLYKKAMYHFQQEFCYKKPWDQYRYRMSKNVYNTLINHIGQYSIRKKLKLKVKKIVNTVECSFDTKRFETLKREYYIKTNKFDLVTVGNQAEMINKALQLSSGFVYDEQSKVRRLNYYRLEKLKELLMVINDKVIIFYNFVEDKKLLLKEIKGAREYKTKQDEIDWCDGKIDCFILSPFSSQFGLNLQEGGSRTIIWYGLIWSAENYSQANARLYRLGQKRDTEIYYILAKGSLDYYVFNKLVKKIKIMDNFIDYLKGDNDEYD